MKSPTKRRSIKRTISREIALIGTSIFILITLITFMIFVSFFPKETEKSIEQLNNTAIQTFNYMETFIRSSTRSLAVASSDSDEIPNYINSPTKKNKSLATLKLGNLIADNSFLRTAAIDVEGVPCLYSVNKSKDKDTELLDTVWYNEICTSNFGSGFSNVYDINIHGYDYYSTAFACTEYYGNRKSILIAYVNIDSLVHNAKSIYSGKVDYYALVDPHGNIFFEYNNDSKNLKNEVIQECTNEQQKTFSKITPTCVVAKRTSITNNFSVISAVSTKTIFSGVLPTLLAGFFLVLIVIFAILFLVRKSFDSVLNPIVELSEKMDIASKGNLDCSVNFPQNNEIGELGNSFNKMLSDLQNYLNIISQSEEKNQRAKFSLLISQINPHFIYNTINSINYLARQHRDEDIVEVNSALIATLRDRLRINDIQIMDSVSQEIYVLKQYIVIIKHMYDGSFEVSYNIEEGLENKQIPKSLIQPLVENSLFHGLIDEESGEINGNINVDVFSKETEKGEKLLIRVADTGIGMSPELIEQVLEHNFTNDDRGKKIGLANIKERLYYLFGHHDSLVIESEPGNGTIITLTLPLSD